MREVTKQDVQQACYRREWFDKAMRDIGELIRHNCLSPEAAGEAVEKLARDWQNRTNE